MSEEGHPEHIRSLTSMPPRYTVHPEHIRSLTSMAPRYTVHPEHKKASINEAFENIDNNSCDITR